MIRNSVAIVSRRLCRQPQLRRNLEENSREWTEEVKLAKNTISSAEIRDNRTTSPQFYQTAFDDNYQKSTATFLNQTADKSLMMLMGYSRMSFRLVDRTVLMGPIAIFPKLALSWMVRSVEEITPESLEFFTLLEPRLDVLLVGVGELENMEIVQTRLRPFLIKSKLRVEIMSTMDAGSTFNFLNADGRSVAACLFPPNRLPEQTSDDMWRFSSVNDDAFQMPTFEGGRDIFGLVGRRSSLPERLIDTFRHNRDEVARERQVAERGLQDSGEIGKGGKPK